MFTKQALCEGKWMLLALAVLSIVMGLWHWWAAVPPLILLVFTVSFFRDPQRIVPADPRAIVAPGDGKVVEVDRVREPHFMDSEATMIAIFLSIFDVHVQRAPVEGEIKLVRYVKGRFLDARHPRASALNENRVVGIESPGGRRVTVRQIAGLIARRVVGWAETGVHLVKGERLGLIRFGSRVELFLPVDTEILVKVGDHVKGGETIVARQP